jgi:hypothetical protein
MRLRHVAILVCSLALAALVVGFAARQNAGTARRARAASAKTQAATAVMVAAAKEQAAAAPTAPRDVPVTPRGLRIKPYVLNTRPAPKRVTRVSESAPEAPGPEPTLDVPAPPDIPTIDLPGSDQPDPCVTDPPSTLDECADMPTLGSMEACVRYRVDCYGPG